MLTKNRRMMTCSLKDLPWLLLFLLAQLYSNPLYFGKVVNFADGFLSYCLPAEISNGLLDFTVSDTLSRKQILSKIMSNVFVGNKVIK